MVISKKSKFDFSKSKQDKIKKQVRKEIDKIAFKPKHTTSDEKKILSSYGHFVSFPSSDTFSSFFQTYFKFTSISKAKAFLEQPNKIVRFGDESKHVDILHHVCLMAYSVFPEKKIPVLVKKIVHRMIPFYSPEQLSSFLLKNVVDSRFTTKEKISVLMMVKNELEEVLPEGQLGKMKLPSLNQDKNIDDQNKAVLKFVESIKSFKGKLEPKIQKIDFQIRPTSSDSTQLVGTISAVVQHKNKPISVEHVLKVSDSYFFGFLLDYLYDLDEEWNDFSVPEVAIAKWNKTTNVIKGQKPLKHQLADIVKKLNKNFFQEGIRKASPSIKDPIDILTWKGGEVFVNCLDITFNNKVHLVHRWLNRAVKRRPKREKAPDMDEHKTPDFN